MLTGTITDHYGDSTRRDLLAYLGEMQLHAFGVDGRGGDHGRTNCTGRADRADQFGSVLVAVAHHGVARADKRPPVTGRTFLTHLGFVLDHTSTGRLFQAVLRNRLGVARRAFDNLLRRHFP